MITNLFFRGSMTHSNLSPSFNLNCLAIPAGTVVRNDSLRLVALVRIVVSESIIYKVIGIIIYKFIYLKFHQILYKQIIRKLYY